MLVHLSRLFYSGQAWDLFFDVIQEHTALTQPAAHFLNVTSRCAGPLADPAVKWCTLTNTGDAGIAEPEPGVILLAYDRLSNFSHNYTRGRTGEVWATRITVSAASED